jgi:hypothetical protein
VKNGEKRIDLTGRKLIAMRDVQDALAAGATSIVTAANCVVTPSAHDFLRQHGIELVENATLPAPSPVAQANSSPTPASDSSGHVSINRRLFSTQEAESIL